MTLFSKQHSSLLSYTKALIGAAEAEDIWADPRKSSDNRKRDNVSHIPESSCRRNGERRVTRRIQDNQWWLHRGYKIKER